MDAKGKTYKFPLVLGKAPRSIADTVQEVRDRLTEHGITWRVPGGHAGRVADLIHRVWAFLWGWTGTDFRRLRVGLRGQVLTRPTDYGLADPVDRSGDFGAGGVVEVDFGMLVDIVFVGVTCGQCYVSFSEDGVLFEHKRTIFASGTAAAPMGGSGVFSVPCRYVKLIDPNDEGLHYEACGEVFRNP